MSALEGLRIAYLTLQATTPGQAAHAHVHEIIGGLRDLGAHVELFEPSYAGPTAPGVLGRFREFARLQTRLVDALDGFDVLYVRGHAFAWQASRAARRRGVPVVQECNGMVEDFFIAWPSARVAGPLIRSWTLSQFRSATQVIAGSEGLAAWLKRETGRDAHVIPNGANPDVFRPAPRPDIGLPDRYAVFFGSLAPWQGVTTSLQAVTDPTWPAGVSLVVIGAGMLESQVRAASESDERIIALGPVAYEDVAPIVSNAICSLVNKEQPQFERAGISPLKLYESMACGVPVVATTRMPGLTDVVERLGIGILVPQNDPHALAQAVATLADDDDLRAEMGRRGRAYVEAEGSWEARSEQTARVIRTAVGR